MSIYNVATLGETDNRITFNDYTANPVFRALARSANKFQIRQQDLPVPFESGSSDFLTLLGDTSYIIQGKMYPADEPSYDSGLMQLRSVASLTLNQEDVLSTDGYIPYIWQDFFNQKQIFMKPLYVELSETTKQGFVQPFTILAKIIDPVIYSYPASQASTGQASPSTSTGAAAYSFTYPVVYGSTLQSITADCNNIGTLPTFPTSIVVNGPVTNPKVTNGATGEYIQVNVTLSSSSDQLTMVYNATMQTIELNGVNVNKDVIAGSTMFKIHPGTTTITLNGSSVGTGAVAVVNYYSGWPLS